ncbi:MAG TPA: ethanolamine ammonia-lyase reactivating factor EutA [Ramlibacter sp.]|uniref:ethanolamine ammonia-lyase reactivating factor EutA n=1 Tax=Ramlibacter sp. TaxID=1917967 RepID=UPI002ED4EB5A
MAHELDIDHEHEEHDEDAAAIGQLIWEQETLQLRTVGIDIGSSTSHLLFARITLQRQSEGFSSRFVVVGREVLWRSPICLTPFLSDGTIDAHALDHFIHDAYHAAGLHRRDIDSGAVILTGEAIKRRNARAIDELFAGESGKFVCATAGHQMECLLAAHGSGATAISARRKECGLHVDIGGGTTKLALIDRGEVVGVAAFAVGGRLLARDAAGAWSRIDDSARRVAKDLGLDPVPRTFADAAAREAVCERLAALIVDQIAATGLDDLGRSLELTDPLPRTVAPAYVTFSGGVSEYIFGRETGDFGDIAAPLAAAVVRQLRQRVRLKVVEPLERIRATVIGASQFTVQVSGKTIHLPDPGVLPVRNIPVLHLPPGLAGRASPQEIAEAFAAAARLQDLAPSAVLALSFTWDGEPEHARLLAMARGIRQFAAPGGVREQPLFLMIDGDVGASLGRILREEAGLRGDLVSVDGIQLRPLDFVDVGELLDPPGVVPIVIKSLLFAAP